MRQNIVAQFIQLLKPWLYYVQLGIVTEKSWALSLYQCWLQALQFSVHLIDLMTILLRYNGFSRAQKAIVSRPAADHQTVTMILFLVILSFPKQNFGKCPGASESSHLELIVAGCPIQSIFPRTSQSSQEMVSSSCEE